MTHAEDSEAPPLKRILSMNREMWDRDDARPAVRAAFQKVLDCGTEALGAEVFSSSREERVVYHTCKSRACPVAAIGPPWRGSGISGASFPTSLTLTSA